MPTQFEDALAALQSNTDQRELSAMVHQMRKHRYNETSENYQTLMDAVEARIEELREAALQAPEDELDPEDEP
jgi:hypothetical protein